MIDRQQLLNDLQGLLTTLEQDLLERCPHEPEKLADLPGGVAEGARRLRAEYDRAKEADRTALSWVDWRAGEITQVAAAWVLSCVFARFLEDNDLVAPPRLSGPGDRLQRARDEHAAFFRTRPTETDREYLLDLFDQLAEQPGAAELFGEQNPLRDEPNWLSGDAAGELLRFFQRIDANTGALTHDFTDPEWNTRFLGDLYQDLSEAARKRFALLQTPDFVEAFILDRTLEPALDEFGLRPSGQQADGSGHEEGRFKMIDPACGSGHFLLGAFDRLLDRWNRKEPATPIRELVQRALDSVHGVDVNPYAVAIARFRLLLSAMKASGVRRLRDAPAYRMHLACGDSLYHGKAAPQQMLGEDWTDESHFFHSENAAELRRILKEGTYHCVVANPPYITVKDKAANQMYRRLYETCHRKYSLAVPFMERIFRLAAKSDGNGCPAGYTGQITANSFMKREFGKKLIEEFLPKIDLTHVVDTAGAYIPGHGTPTAILFGRNRKPLADTVRAVMGIRGEPATPDEPARGLVWSAITEQIDQAGSESEFVSVSDTERDRFATHPWSIGGGGAAELKETLDESTDQRLSTVIDEIGVFGITAADDVMYAHPAAFRRYGVATTSHLPLILGDEVRDWSVPESDHVLFPYHDETLVVLDRTSGHYRWLWPNRTTLWARATFSRQTYREEGRTWWEWHQTTLQRLRTRFSIVFAFVASHNHFVLDRGGKVFNRSAPLIKLPDNATENEHLALLGLLNSSVACFFFKQVSHQKQLVGGDGVRVESRAVVPYEFAATQMKTLPIPSAYGSGKLRERLISLSTKLDALGTSLGDFAPRAVVDSAISGNQPIREAWETAQLSEMRARSRMVLLQEEIDFVVYEMWGYCDDSLSLDLEAIDESVSVGAGARPFDILRGRNEEGFDVPAGVPNDWPIELRDAWDRRIAAIKASSALRVIEDPHYKRRWRGRQGLFNHTENQDPLKEGCAGWLLDRLESYFDIDGRMAGEPSASAPGVNCKLGVEVVSVGKLADIARADERFQEVGAVYTGGQGFDVERLVEELVRGESVPLLPVLRYKPKGLTKRAEWEKTWELQRREDAGEDVGDIPVPPKYTSADFISTGGARYWALRGKLDVPKERWVSFPHCEGADGTPVIAWAGLDHLQLAQAVSSFYVDVKERQGGSDDPRLVPLLGCLLELLPWLKQWHNEPAADYDGLRMGDFYEGFVNDEARSLPRPAEPTEDEDAPEPPTATGWTLEEIRAWTPPQRRRGGRRSRRT